MSKRSIDFVASASYGQTGQLIGIVTGTDRKFGLALDFVGSRSGKRRETTNWSCTSPALVLVRNVDKKGRKDDTVYIAWDDDGTLRREEISYDQAIEIAGGSMSPAALAAFARLEEARVIEEKLDASSGKDPEELCASSSSSVYGASALDITMPCTYGDLAAARRRRLAHLRGESPPATPDRPIEIDDHPSDPAAGVRILQEERERLLARVAEIDAALASPDPAP